MLLLWADNEQKMDLQLFTARTCLNEPFSPLPNNLQSIAKKSSIQKPPNDVPSITKNSAKEQETIQIPPNNLPIITKQLEKH